MKLQLKRVRLFFILYVLFFHQILFSMEEGGKEISAAATSSSTTTSQSMLSREKLAAFYKALKAKTVGEFVDVECLVCHEKAKVEGKDFITSVKHLLQLWSQGEIPSSDYRKWWIGLHTIGLNLKSQFSSLLMWYIGGYVGHPCHLSCLAESCMQHKIELVHKVTQVSESEDVPQPFQLNFLKYECPLKDQPLNQQEIKIIQHYLDITIPDWFKLPAQMIIQYLRRMSAENIKAFNTLIASSEALKAYLPPKEHQGMKLYHDSVFETLSQVVEARYYPSWLEDQERLALLRSKERERFQPTSTTSSDIEPQEEEQAKLRTAALLSKHPWLKMTTGVNRAVAKDYLATFIGFQRIAEAIAHGKERICASEDLALFLAAQSNFHTFQQFLGEPEMGVEATNPIRDEIARRWIRNAAARVFNRLLRSFLELVVNACDATNPGPSVGKFGMGFLSILQLLGYETTYGVKIVIQTMPRPDEYIRNPFPYQITIEIPGFSEIERESERLAKWKSIDFSKDFDISVKFEKLPEDAGFIERLAGNPTGTLITITPNVGEFTAGDLTELTMYTHYLDFYEPVATILNGAEQIGGAANAPKIFVNLAPNKLEVLDHGTGISLYVALFKLFIPSSSTKANPRLMQQRINMRDSDPAMPAKLVEFKGKTLDDKQAHFLITVNGVLVLDIDLPADKIALDKKSHDKKIDILVQMPAATQLTLARDELMIGADPNGPNNIGPEEAFLKRVIIATINEYLQPNKDHRMLRNFFTALKEWESRSANLYIKDRFTKHFREELLKKIGGKNVPVTEEFMERFSNCAGLNLGFEPVGLSSDLANYNYSEFESRLKLFFEMKIPQDDISSQIVRSGIDQQLIKGMAVFFVPSGDGCILKTNEVSKLGLKNTIFAPIEWLKMGSGIDFLTAKNRLVNKISNKFVNQDFGVEKDFIDGILFTNAVDAIVDTDKNAITSKFDAESYINLAPEILTAKEDTLALQLLQEYYFLPSFTKFILPIFSEDLPVHNPERFSDFYGPLMSEEPETNKFFKDFTESKGMFFYDKDTNIFYKRLRPFEASMNEKLKQFGAAAYNMDDEGAAHAFVALSKEIFKDIQKSGDFERIPAYKVFNILMGGVLAKFGIITHEDAHNSSKFIMIGSDIIWPLRNHSLEMIGKTFLALNEFLFAHKRPVYRFGKSDIEKAIASKEDSISSYIKQLITLWKSKGKVCFVGIKGLTLNQRVIELVKNEIVHFATLDSALSKNFNDFSLIETLMPITNIWISVTGGGADDKLIDTFKEKIKSIFETYASIPKNFIPFVYGAGASKITAKNSCDDIPVEACIRLIKSLKSIGDKNQTLTRLLNLTVEDAVERCNRDFQREDLAQRQLFIPNILFNSPLSVVAFVFDRLSQTDEVFALEIVKTLLTRARNCKELLFAANLLLVDENSILFLKCIPQKKPDLINAVELICNKFIPEKIGKDAILDSYQKCRCFNSPEIKLGYFKKLTVSQTINSYLSSVLDPTLFEVAKSTASDELIGENSAEILNTDEDLMRINDLRQELPLSLKRLINAHVAGRGIVDLLRLYRLENAKKIIMTARNDFDLGKITQSIEAGSEREPVNATLIECLQNSVDAIQDFISKLNARDDSIKNSYEARLKTQSNDSDAVINELCRIEYKIEMIPSHSDNLGMMSLSIIDHIGFPSLKQLLTDFMLPDYSSKSPELGNIGDMGNGTFKIYQHASRVFLLTRMQQDPNKFYLLIIKPHRSNITGLIDDLDFDCLDISNWMLHVNPTFFGTSFKIIFEEKDLVSLRSDILDAKDFLFECLSSVDVEFGKRKLDLFLKDKERFIHINRNKASNAYTHTFAQIPRDLQEAMTKKKKSGEGYSDQSPVFMFGQRPNEFMQSYLTTNGVPFKSLGSVLEEENLLPPEFISKLRYGYVVNLSLNTYEPVQSRTKLKMSTLFKNELRKALLEAYFIFGLKKAENPATRTVFLSTHFTHLASETSGIGQLTLGKEKNDFFKEFYKDFTTNKHTDAYPTETNFFDFYRLISLPHLSPEKSLYDFVERLNLDFTWPYRKLLESESIAKREADLEFEKVSALLISQYPQNKSMQNVSLEEKGKLAHYFTDNYFAPAAEKWQQARTQIIKGWTQFMQQKYFDPPTLISESLVKTIFIPWAEKKLVNIEPKFKKIDELIRNNPQFKTLQDLDGERKRSTEAAGMLGIATRDADVGLEVVQKLKSYNLKDFINTLLKCYCDAFYDILIRNGKFSASNPIQSAYFYISDDSVKGSFTPALSSLKINLHYAKISDLVELGAKLFWLSTGKIKNSSEIKNLSAYLGLFDPALFNPNTVVHELEHSRRGDKACEGAHIDGVSADNESVNFDACARSWAVFAFENDLFDEWVQLFGSAAKNAKFTDLFSACDKDERRGLSAIMESLFNMNEFKGKEFLIELGFEQM